MEKSYETGWEKHGETWRPPSLEGPLGGLDIQDLRNLLFPPGMVEAFAGASPPSGWLLCQGQLVSRQLYRRLFNVIGTTYGAGDGTTTFGLPNLKGQVIVGLDAAQTEFDALGETGGAKTVTLTSAQMPVHNHTVDANNFNTDTRDTNHAHNVYARNQDTGWMDRNASHWHSASIGNVYFMNHQDVHRHGGGCGFAAEAASPSTGTGCAVPVNVNSTDTNHLHNFNHDHPSTNYQSESPWAGNYTHYHNANHGHTMQNTGGGAAHNNLQPYMVMNYCIKT